MKKFIFLFSLLILMTEFVNAQVFNTGQTLKKKAVAFGVEPSVILSGGNDFILFLHGGYGIKKGIDFGVKTGLLGPKNYFGADVEFALGKRFSLSCGAHSYGDFGLDGTFIGTLPINRDIRLTSGADLDVNLGNSTDFLFWVPIDIEISVKNNMNFIFEVEIGITNSAYNIIGAGVCYYL